MPSTFQRDFANPANTSHAERTRRTSVASPSNKRSRGERRKTFHKGLLRARRPSAWPPTRLPGHWRALGLGLLTAVASVALAGFSPGGNEPEGSLETATHSREDRPLKAIQLPNPLHGVADTGGDPHGKESDNVPEDTKQNWHQAQLKKGETLAGFSQRTDLGRETALSMARATQDVFSIRRLKPEHSLRFTLDREGKLQKARYHIDDERYLSWSRTPKGGLRAALRTYSVTTRVREAYGRIDTSLFRAGEEAGLSTKMIMELAETFQWDIDFARGLRKGDWFRVVYRQTYRDGKRVSSGPVLAAEFHNRGKTYTAIRFTAADGQADYYQPNGHSIRKAFLRSPVEFSRVTSGFSRKREHPVLGYTRAHEGVDYAAPQGTPIRATGNGRVIHRGRKGGYGHVVKIEHANGHYTTVYAHMSRYSGSVREGTRVQQGETIGYVGQSGLATGPHLHYEFHVRDQARNPLKVDLPEAEPLPEKYRNTFAQRRHHMLAWLAAVGPADENRLATQSAGDGEPSG